MPQLDLYIYFNQLLIFSFFFLLYFIIHVHVVIYYCSVLKLRYKKLLLNGSFSINFFKNCKLIRVKKIRNIINI